MFKILCTYICLKIYIKCNIWRVAAGPTYIQDARFLKINISKCLRKILRIFWPDKIANKELWKRTKQPRIDLQIRKCKWGWLGHTLRKPSDDRARQALDQNRQCKRGRGRPRNTWRRTVLEEAKGFKKTWAEIQTDAKNRVRWRIHVEAPCSAAEWWDSINESLMMTLQGRNMQPI